LCDVKEVTRAHKGWALDSVILQNQITRYNKEDIHDPPSEGEEISRENNQEI
jgi:dynein heavy chain